MLSIKNQHFTLPRTENIKFLKQPLRVKVLRKSHLPNPFAKPQNHPLKINCLVAAYLGDRFARQEVCLCFLWTIRRLKGLLLKTLSSNKTFKILRKKMLTVYFAWWPNKTLANSACHSQSEIILSDSPFNYAASFLPFSIPNIPQLSNIQLSIFKSVPD